MNKESNISRAIVKAVGIFGGVQAVNVICSVVRAKLIALWIGPVGMGLFGLFNNTVEMIIAITSLGIRNSSIPEIAKADNSGDARLLATTISLIRRWSWLVSIFGAVVTLAFASWLSQLVFDTDAHTWEFVLLASVMMFNGLANGEQSILQGTSMLRRLAHASMWGVVSGLVLSVPMFYFWGEKSVVPSIIVYNAMIFLFSYIFRKKDYTKVNLSMRDTLDKGKGFVRLGIYMTVSGFITMLFTYIFSIYLNRTAGTDAVGLYQAGYTLYNKYVALVFTAIGYEYYPRISGVSDSKLRLHAFVSQQINVVMLVLLPLISVFLLARELMVSILYTSEFSTIILYISLAIIGTVFRAYSWCLAFVILAKGDGKTFIVTETISSAIGFILNVAFFELWGLNGLGIAYTMWYFIYCVIIQYVYNRKYKLSVSSGAIVNTLITLAVVVAVFAMVEYDWWILAIIATLVISLYCGRKIYVMVKK